MCIRDRFIALHMMYDRMAPAVVHHHSVRHPQSSVVIVWSTSLVLVQRYEGRAMLELNHTQHELEQLCLSHDWPVLQEGYSDSTGGTRR